jgi:hypothetical protein
MSESIASRDLREAGETARAAARWTDPLTQAERRVLAGRLLRASRRYGFKENDGTYSPARVIAAAECRDLHRDVTGRAGAVA